MYKYSTFWRRFWAGMIDGLVFLPLGMLDDFFTLQSYGATVFVAWNILHIAAWSLYCVLLHARFGQTLGKWCMGVKLLDVSEQSLPSLWQAFKRDSVGIALNVFWIVQVSYLVSAGRYVHGAELEGKAGFLLKCASFLWFALEMLTLLTNEKRRALHDFIAGTVVIQVPRFARSATMESQGAA